MAYEDPKATAQIFDGYAKKIVVTVDASNGFLGGIHHPWRRFFARFVEIGMTGSMLFFILMFVFSAAMPKQADEFLKVIENPIVASVVVYFSLIPIEAAMLSLYGTTPAKWLFGIRISHPAGRLLSFSEAFYRELIVFSHGVFFGIPFIALIPQLFAYRRLKNTGTTLWDKSTGVVVTHKKLGLIRAIFCAIAVIFLMILNSAFIAAGY